MSTTNVLDVTGSSLGSVSIPAGWGVAGYTTGSGGVPWSTAQWNAHPKAIRIDQNASASDLTADVLDVENGAATVADVPVWVTHALANFKAGTRKGQRSPAIYVNQSNITAVVNALVAAGITSGVGIWLADYNYTQANAVTAVAAASGPFPIIGIQYSDQGNGGLSDLDVFSTAWLNNVSGSAPVVVTVKVPVIAKMTAGPAHNALVAAGLVPTAWAGQKASDVVVGSIPVAGTVVNTGTKVEILTTVKVPNVVGLTAGVAHNDLVVGGLVPTAYAGQLAADKITATLPEAGTVVTVGTSVQMDSTPYHGAYVTDGSLDLANIAAKLGVPVNTVLRMTAVKYQTFGDDLGAWLAAVLTGAEPWIVPVPAGVTLWCD